MKYTLLQAPPGECSLGQIEILNLKNVHDADKAARLALKGYRECGHIESDLSITNLKYAFRSDVDKQLQIYLEKERKILGILHGNGSETDDRTY